MGIKRVIKTFRQGNVCVCGLRGTGKDMLIGNVIARRKEPYVSNVPYGGQYNPLEYDKIDIHNSSENFVTGNIQYYTFPYKDGTDIYISDCGVYFPSQDFVRLNKKYESISALMALSRHLGSCNVHINAQNLNRVWDKIREQSDIYIMCNKCIYIHGLVIQIITTYDKYESCISRVKPYPHKPLIGKTRRALWESQRDAYYVQNGEIKRHILIYRNKATYDTRYFKTLLEGGQKVDPKNC